MPQTEEVELTYRRRSSANFVEEDIDLDDDEEVEEDSHLLSPTTKKSGKSFNRSSAKNKTR